MNFKKSLFLYLVLLFLPCITKGTEAHPPTSHNPASKAELISPYKVLSPDIRKIPIGLWIHLEEGWHSYWHYPGESGKALTIYWTKPQGVEVSSFKWPLPERIQFGSLTSFGYKKSFLLIGELSLPLEQKTLKPHLSVLQARGLKGSGQVSKSTKESRQKQAQVQIKAQVKWLICQEVCVPIQQSLNISWLVEKQAKINKSHQALFDKFTKLQPQTTTKTLWLSQEGPYWKAHFLTKKALKLVDVLPFAKYPLSVHPPILLSENGGLEHSFRILPQKGSPSSSSRWKKKTSKQTTALNSTENKVLTIFKNKDNKKLGFIYSFVNSKNQGFKKSLFWFLFLSFIGGLLLNLMPCVLPIVFLKFSNTVQQIDQKKAITVLQNIFYSVGVTSAFLFLAFWIFLLKKGGEAIGWGFHLQSPYVLLCLIFLFTLISLSFMGWLSFPGLPFFHPEKQQGYFKHFLTGVLSTASASPCTAPFMGASVGYGLAGSGVDLILIFLFLGLGLSFPYLLLSIFPTWIKYVPLPGKWTQTLKHFMAFPMLGTALWLITVLNQQKIDYLFVILFCLLILTLAVWVLNQLRPRFKVLAWGLFVVALVWPFWHVYQGAKLSQIKWDTFSLKKMEQIRKEGQEALFVNITADWCLTCKFNERVTFQNKKVIQFFKSNNILALKGDWTKPNKEITQFLEMYDRAGIPFYLYIPANKTESFSGEDIVSNKKPHLQNQARLLPALLTPALFFKYTK